MLQMIVRITGVNAILHTVLGVVHNALYIGLSIRLLKTSQISAKKLLTANGFAFLFWISR
jgi:hypothetical protein